MTDRKELAERIEAAEGPSRELNEAICAAFGIPLAVEDEVLGWIDNVRPFTTSIDAALTLVPDGWGWTLRGTRYAELRHPYSHLLDTEGYAATPALALCAAALRAGAEHEG